MTRLRAKSATAGPPTWMMLVSSLDERDGGPPAAVLGLSVALQRDGDRVAVLAARVHGEPESDDVREARQTGVAVEQVAVRRRTSFRFSVAMLYRSIKISEDADIVCVHGFYQFSCVLGWLVARLRRVPLVLQPHGVFEPYQEQQGAGRKRLFMCIVGRRIVRSAAVVVVCSDLELHGVTATLSAVGPIVRVAGLGVHVRGASPKREPHSRRLLFLSRIAPKKRLDLVLGAVNELAERGRPVNLTVCGSGEADLVQNLQSMPVPLGSVSWAGHVSGRVRDEALTEHDLLVLPSDNENYAMAVTEALAAGLPVITSTQTGAAEHVLRSGAGWVLDNPTSQMLADAIDAALASPANLDLMSRRAVTYSETELTWASVARRWRAIAHELRSK